MPHMPTILPAEKTDREIVSYIHRRGNNIRIQLEGIEDLRDARGRVLERGKTLHAQFEKGLFVTNIAEVQDLLEDSYAYKAKEVERRSVIEERAMTQQLDSLLAIAEDNPELARELRSRLTKMQLSAKKAQKQADDSGDGVSVEGGGSIETNEE